MTNSFSRKVLHWFDSHGRHDLPWQENSTPYRVWVSEIMLQQTQVATVIPYYKRFTKKFPTVKSLATAESDQVLHLWTGLGYYARARNLHKTAQIIQSVFEGSFPNSVADLIELPGIGRSTAGAIVALSMNVPATILDGNVKRVLTRNFAISGWPEQGKIKQQLWDIAENLTPNQLWTWVLLFVLVQNLLAFHAHSTKTASLSMTILFPNFQVRNQGKPYQLNP